MKSAETEKLWELCRQHVFSIEELLRLKLEFNLTDHGVYEIIRRHNDRFKLHHAVVTLRYFTSIQLPLERCFNAIDAYNPKMQGS